MKITALLLTTILITTISSSISAKSNSRPSLRSRAVQANKDNCIQTSQISSSVIGNPLTTCTANDTCNSGLCRLFTLTDNQFLECDEGNNFEGLGWPALCADDSESASESSEAEALDVSDGDIDDNDTGGDNSVPVRSDCIETDSSDYESALKNNSTQCVTNNDCSVGPCRLAVGSENKWLFCDEANSFDSIGWLPVCDEQEVPIRQPSEDDTNNDIDVDFLDESSGFCFPGTAIVTVLDKGDIPMSELQLEDLVLVDTKGNYESVYTFGHYYPNSPKSPFVKVTTIEGSELTLSLNHMVKTATSGTIPAVRIKKGDSLLNSSGKIALVESTSKIQLQQGMYAPFTASGYLIVDNILVSNYVALHEQNFLQIAGKSIASHQWIAHAFNSPHRMYCRYVTACTTERYNAEGMSQFVATPFALSKWIFHQNTIITGVSSVMIVMLCGIFSLVEQYPIFVVSFLFGIFIIVKGVTIERKQKAN